MTSPLYKVYVNQDGVVFIGRPDRQTMLDVNGLFFLGHLCIALKDEDGSEISPDEHQRRLDAAKATGR